MRRLGTGGSMFGSEEKATPHKGSELTVIAYCEDYRIEINGKYLVGGA
jgi:hypothetical protein